MFGANVRSLNKWKADRPLAAIGFFVVECIYHRWHYDPE
jgi:hypothetical protein